MAEKDASCDQSEAVWTSWRASEVEDSLQEVPNIYPKIENVKEARMIVDWR